MSNPEIAVCELAMELSQGDAHAQIRKEGRERRDEIRAFFFILSQAREALRKCDNKIPRCPPNLGDRSIPREYGSSLFSGPLPLAKSLRHNRAPAKLG